MKPVRQIAFGYSTQCNIRCGHCVAADASPGSARMNFDRAKQVIREMARCHVTGISFTAGEPLLFMDDICRLIRICRENKIYSRVVTNGYWAKSPEDSDRVVSELMSHGLSQLRLSFSRWHQEHINRDNIVYAASSCQKTGLDYFVSFVTDFSEKDDRFEAFLRHHRLKYFPEPIIYFGRANSFDQSRVFTDYQPNVCSMNAYLSPEQDMYACCDAAHRFSTTGFFYLGNLRSHDIDTLFRQTETHPLFHSRLRDRCKKDADHSSISADKIDLT